MLAVLAALRLRAALRGARYARSLDRPFRAAAWGECTRAWGAGRLPQEGFVLRIYSVVLDLVRNLRPLLKELERADADLARQCRRALTSVPLNIAEGSYSRGKNRRARYHNALGSMREVQACFEVAAALGYVDDLDACLVGRIDHVLGTLVKLAGGH